MITKTEITGRTYRSATGHDNSHRPLHVKVGSRVALGGWYDCGDGEDICTRFYGTVARIGQGTEHGMRGTTAIAEVAWDDHHGRKACTTAVAVRHLEPSRV